MDVKNTLLDNDEDYGCDGGTYWWQRQCACSSVVIEVVVTLVEILRLLQTSTLMLNVVYNCTRSSLLILNFSTSSYTFCAREKEELLKSFSRKKCVVPSHSVNDIFDTYSFDEGTKILT